MSAFERHPRRPCPFAWKETCGLRGVRKVRGRERKTHIHRDMAHDRGVVWESDVFAFVVDSIAVDDGVGRRRFVFDDKGALDVDLHCSGIRDGIFETRARRIRVSRRAVRGRHHGDLVRVIRSVREASHQESGSSWVLAAGVISLAERFPRRAHAYSVYLLLTGPPFRPNSPRTFPRSVRLECESSSLRTEDRPAQQHICLFRPAMDWLDAGVWMSDSCMEPCVGRGRIRSRVPP